MTEQQIAELRYSTLRFIEASEEERRWTGRLELAIEGLLAAAVLILPFVR